MLECCAAEKADQTTFKSLHLLFNLLERETERSGGCVCLGGVMMHVEVLLHRAVQFLFTESETSPLVEEYNCYDSDAGDDC